MARKIMFSFSSHSENRSRAFFLLLCLSVRDAQVSPEILQDNEDWDRNQRLIHSILQDIQLLSISLGLALQRQGQDNSERSN
jgi:hypothetical protein